MDIEITNNGDITIAAINGNLDTNTSSDAQEKILPLIKNNSKIVINMSNCEYVSSAGLRTLLVIAKKTKQLKAQGVMAGLSDDIKDVMEMTGFNDMFDDYKTVDEAVKALKGGS